MCDLLGMWSNLPSTLNLSISTLASHGAGAVSLRDGWGVAYSEGPDVRLIKDPEPANDSDWVRFIRDHSFRSNIVIAHVRTATMGARVYRNTQPFIRELGGRMHFFAHNGWLPHIFERCEFDSAQFTPIGDTDSERAYCGLLEKNAEDLAATASFLTPGAAVRRFRVRRRASYSGACQLPLFRWRCAVRARTSPIAGDNVQG
jgi:predicted glutamine amidotransferase